MKVMAAGKAKNGFGLLMDTARAEPVTIEKHGRPVAVVISVEEYERLKARAEGVATEKQSVVQPAPEADGRVGMPRRSD